MSLWDYNFAESIATGLERQLNMEQGTDDAA